MTGNENTSRWHGEDARNYINRNFEEYEINQFNPYEEAWQFCADAILDDAIDGSLEAGITTNRSENPFEWTNEREKDFVSKGFRIGWNEAQQIIASEGKARFLLHCLLQSMKNENGEWYGQSFWKSIEMLEKVLDLVKIEKEAAPTDTNSQ